MGFLSKIEILAMSNLVAADTGIDGIVIWVSGGEFEGKDSQHGPRIKVMLGNKITTEGLNQATTVTLTNPSKVIGKLPSKIEKKVLSFLKKNQATLLSYWKNEISTKEMIQRIEKV
jgi:hypothetical protein